MEIPLYFWFETLSLITGLVLIRKLRHSILIYFVPFLALIVIYEYGTLKGFFTIKGSNLWAVNIITTIEFLFFSLVITHFIPTRKKRQELRLLIACTLILTVLNVFFLQGRSTLHTYSLLLGGLLIVGLACYFFYNLLELKIQEKSILLHSPFWVVTGILFFYLGQFAFFSFFEYMIRSKDIRYRTLFDAISSFTNAILYSCIIIAFLCQRRAIQK